MVLTRVVVYNAGYMKVLDFMDARILEVVGLPHGRSRLQWVLALPHGTFRLLQIW